MLSNILIDKLILRENSVTFENVLDNAKASSGGERDLDFLKFLIENKLLIREEGLFKRNIIDYKEDDFEEKYRKIHYESSRHYLCRAAVQEELKNIGIKTTCSTDVGNMNILRANSNYDIVSDDFSFIIDIGLAPARNLFRGLTERRVKYYLITTYFDEYMDDIIFCMLKRSDDISFMEAVKEYEEGSTLFIPQGYENEYINLENEPPNQETF